MRIKPKTKLVFEIVVFEILQQMSGKFSAAAAVCNDNLMQLRRILHFWGERVVDAGNGDICFDREWKEVSTVRL